jgi:hypothetical protein
VSSINLGSWGTIVVKSCDHDEECEIGIQSEGQYNLDYLTRDDAIKLIEFLQIEYRLVQYGEDDYVEPECEHDFVPFGDGSKLRCQKCYLIHRGEGH